MTKEETYKWAKHEFFEVIKQASAVVVAMVTLGGFTITMWSYFGFWVPLSAHRHEEDLKTIRTETTTQYNSLKRSAITTRADILQMRITVLADQVRTAQEAIAAYDRALVNPGVSEQDKEIARRRTVILKHDVEWTTERQRLVYIQIGKLREILTKLPYDARYGDIDDIPGLEDPK